MATTDGYTNAEGQYVKNTEYPLPYRFFINYLLGPAGIRSVDNRFFTREQKLTIKEALFDLLDQKILRKIRNLRGFRAVGCVGRSPTVTVKGMDHA